MNLTLAETKSILRGVCNFRERDGWLSMYHFTDAQLESFTGEAFFYPRAHHSAGITAQFKTDAEHIAFDYKLSRRCSDDSIDVFVNDTAHRIFKLEGQPDEGHFVCALPAGEKRVTVYFPLDSEAAIRDFAIDGAWKPIRPRKKVLWIGDSITQGYGPLLAGYSYANIANRALHWDILVQAIGGLRYDDRFLLPIASWNPERIVVALGTNGCGKEDNVPRAEKFFAALTKLYPDVPTLVLTPVYRTSQWEAVLSDNPGVRAICERYPNITVIDGASLLPHVPEMFLDGLHPNALGGMHYADALVKTIRKLKF